MQRPVIASDVGGLGELVSDLETPILVPMQDPLALARAIQELLDHPEKAIRMGIQGRKKALEKFTLHQNVLQYEETYKELLLGPRITGCAS